MTVSSSSNSERFQGNGTTKVFPLPFRFFDNEDVTAYLLDNTSFAQTPLTLGVNYTLIGAGEPEEDGNPVSQLTMLVAPPTGQTLVVERIMDPVQETEIINQARFYPEIHENVFDRLTMLIQQAINSVRTALSLDAARRFFDARGFQIKNLGAPTAANDATTKTYVDTADSNLSSRIDSLSAGLPGTNYAFPWSTTTTQSTKTLTPGFEFASANLYLNGIAQTYGRSFSVAGNQIVLAEAIPAGTEVYAILGQYVIPADPVPYGPKATLEQLGVSSSNNPTENASILISAILNGVEITGSNSAYVFTFDGTQTIYGGEVLRLDLGPWLHTFNNWGGLVGNNVSCLSYNGRIDCNNTYCKGLGRFRNLIRVTIGTMEFQNVFCINPSGENQFFALEYSSNNYGDNALVIDIGSVFIKNVRTQTYVQSSGLAIPMTILGNYGSTSSQVQIHQINIGNFHVEEYYSVDQDGITPIDGDSDVMRLFTNPTQVTIGNLYAKNIAKRFFKTQEESNINCGTVLWDNDGRFPQSVFIGFFEAQLANSGNPTRFNVGICTSIQAEGSQRPLLFNASGLDHSISIDDLTYRNSGFFSSNRNIGIDIRKAVGAGLSVTATSSTKLRIRNIVDTSISNINVSEGLVENFEITFDQSKAGSTSFFLDNLHFNRGKFINWSVNNRVASFYTIKDVQISYTLGSSYVRALRPVSGGFRIAEGLRVTDSTGIAAGIFETAASSSGELAITNFRATGGANIATGVSTTGSWQVKLNDCTPSSYTGAGATVKTATYA